MTKYEELKQMCEETKTSLTGIHALLDYYTDNLGWSMNKAVDYTLELFENGTIEQIKTIIL